MKSIRIITQLLVVLFALFLLMNCFYTFFAGYRHVYGDVVVFSPKMSVFKPFVMAMNQVYFLVHILLYIGVFLFLVFCNRYVKKNRLGKRYHFFIILLGFFPIVNWFLKYIIWRKLNKNIYEHFKISSKISNLKISFAWIFSAGAFLFFLVSSFFVMVYYSSPENIIRFEVLRNLIFLISFILLIGYSFTALSYYWNFLKLTKGSPMNIAREIQLLDNPE